MFRIPKFKLQLVREGSDLYETKQISCSSDAAKIVYGNLKDKDRECIVALLLDVKNKVIGTNLVSMGSLTASVGHPREIFKAAILANAACIILGHNHPSGDTHPSRDDDSFTKEIEQAGRFLQIPLLDHIIVGYSEYSYYSYKEEKRLK